MYGDEDDFGNIIVDVDGRKPKTDKNASDAEDHSDGGEVPSSYQNPSPSTATATTVNPFAALVPRPLAQQQQQQPHVDDDDLYSGIPVVVAENNNKSVSTESAAVNSTTFFSSGSGVVPASVFPNKQHQLTTTTTMPTHATTLPVQSTYHQDPFKNTLEVMVDKWTIAMVKEMVSSMSISFGDGFPTKKEHKEALKALNNTSSERAKERASAAASPAASASVTPTVATPPAMPSTTAMFATQSFHWLRFSKVLFEENLKNPAASTSIDNKAWVTALGDGDVSFTVPSSTRSEAEPSAQQKAKLSTVLERALQHAITEFQSKTSDVIYDISYNIQKRGLIRDRCDLIANTIVKAAFEHIQTVVLPQWNIRLTQILDDCWEAKKDEEGRFDRLTEGLHLVLLELGLRWVASFFPYVQHTMRRDGSAHLAYEPNVTVTRDHYYHRDISKPDGTYHLKDLSTAKRLLRRAVIKRDMVAEHREGRRSTSAVPVPREWFLRLLAVLPDNEGKRKQDVTLDDSEIYRLAIPTTSLLTFDLELGDLKYQYTPTVEQAEKSPSDVIFLSEALFLVLLEYFGGGPKVSCEGCCEEATRLVLSHVEEPIISVTVLFGDQSFTVEASPVESVSDILVECANEMTKCGVSDDACKLQLEWVTRSLRYGLVVLDREEDFNQDTNAADVYDRTTYTYKKPKLNLRALPVTHPNVQSWMQATGDALRVTGLVYTSEADIAALTETEPEDDHSHSYNYSYSSFGRSERGHSTVNRKCAPGVSGLVNLGNTCYMNSALQILSNATSFREALLAFPASRTSDASTSLVCAFREVLQGLWQGGLSTSFEPKHWKTTIGKSESRFAGYEQQDSIEFIDVALDRMHEELNLVGKKHYRERDDDRDREFSIAELSDIYWQDYRDNNQSLIADWFCGQTKTSYKCSVCPNSSVVFEALNTLPVPILSEIEFVSIDVTVFIENTNLRTDVPATATDSVAATQAEEDQEQQTNQHGTSPISLIRMLDTSSTSSSLETEWQSKIFKMNLRVRIPKESTNADLIQAVKTQLLRSDEQQQGVTSLHISREDEEPINEETNHWSSSAKFTLDTSSDEAKTVIENLLCFQSAPSSQFLIGHTTTSLTNHVPAAVPGYRVYLSGKNVKGVVENRAANESKPPSSSFGAPAVLPYALTQFAVNVAAAASAVPFMVRFVPHKATPNDLWVLADELLGMRSTCDDTAAAEGVVEGDANSVKDASSLQLPQQQHSQEAQQRQSYDLQHITPYSTKTNVSRDTVPFRWTPAVAIGDRFSIIPKEDHDEKEGSRWNTNVLCAPILEHPSLKQIPSPKEAAAKKAATSITLDGCIQRMGQSMTLKDADAWYCPKCKTHVEATSDCQLYRLPKVLVCYFKRFKLSSHGFTMTKNDTTVQIPLLLKTDLLLGGKQHNTEHDEDAQEGEKESMTTPVYAESEDTNDSERPQKFDGYYFLRGVVYHSGSLSGGHYTAKAFCDGALRWVYYNDQSAYLDDTPPSPEGVYVMLYEQWNEGVKLPENYFGNKKSEI